MYCNEHMHCCTIVKVGIFFAVKFCMIVHFQITYGDYNEVVHGSGFLRDKLGKVLPNHMIASRRKLEYERKILAKYSEICQYGFEDMKVRNKKFQCVAVAKELS